MGRLLGWLILIGIGWFVYQLGYSVGGGNNSCNIMPVVILFVIVEIVGFIVSWNRIKKERSKGD